MPQFTDIPAQASQHRSLPARTPASTAPLTETPAMVQHSGSTSVDFAPRFSSQLAFQKSTCPDKADVEALPGRTKFDHVTPASTAPAAVTPDMV